MSREGAEAWLEALLNGDPLGTGGGIAVGAIVFVLSFVSVLVVSRLLAGPARANGPSAISDTDPGLGLTFSGRKCSAATPSALALLGTDRHENAWRALLTRFNSPTLETAMEALVRSGTEFRQILNCDESTYYEISGKTERGLCQIVLYDVSVMIEETSALEDALAKSEAERAYYKSVLDEIPTLSWIATPEGECVWQNAASAAVVRQEGGPATAPFGADDLAQVNGVRGQRLAIENEDGSKQWYAVTKRFLDGGNALFVASDASRVVDAEETLHRFICTLTETFAHIPIGLAVFDADRSLSMFNPALSELLSIDPTWLAARPDLTGFLERLREQRKMPEARDTEAWRNKVSSIERDSERGEFSEDWDLPGGQTLRVVGRPHPQGAVALLFEDISIAKSLEQKYRTEIGLSKTILDTLSEAVAVFDTAGALVFTNRSFKQVWGFDPASLSKSPNIHDVRKAWEERSPAHQLFDKASDFVTGTSQRTNWRARFETTHGKMLLGQFAPLPNGSSLMTFLDITNGGSTMVEMTSAYEQLTLDRQNERDLVGLSLQHLKSYLARQEGGDAREIRAALGDKLSMMEGLLSGMGNT